MPRTGKGGKREGSSQTAYANRTDLNNRGPQPITTSPGQPYGQAQMQEDAQKAVPMAGVQTPAPAPSAPQNEPQAPMQAPQQPQPQGIQPGDVNLFAPAPHPVPDYRDQPTSSPGMLAARASANLAKILSEAAASPYATHAVQELAAVAKNLGL